MLLSGLSVVEDRLSDYTLTRARAQANAAADAVTGKQGEALERALDSSARASGGEVLLVGDDGRILARGGPRLLEPPEEILRAAAAGERVTERVGDRQVTTAPVIFEEGYGGVVVVTDEPQESLRELFVNSWIDAATLASVLGGGLLILLAAQLSGRIGRLASGARSIELGDLSSRIDPGYGDELGELAGSFNAMAARLQDSFAHLENRVAERTAELEAERARMEAVLRQMPSGVVIAEAPSERIVLSNEKAERIRRRPLPSYIGAEESYEHKVLSLDGRPYGPREWPLTRSIRAGEEVSDEELVLVHDDGARSTVRVSSCPIRDHHGRIVAGVAVFYDVTEQKRAEEEIRQLNEELEERVEERTAQLEHERATLDAILHNLSEGVLAVEVGGGVVFANSATREMLGLGDGETPERVPHSWGDFDLARAVARCATEREPIAARVGDARAKLLQIRLIPLPEFGEGRGGGARGGPGPLGGAQAGGGAAALPGHGRPRAEDAAHSHPGRRGAALGVRRRSGDQGTLPRAHPGRGPPHATSLGDDAEAGPAGHGHQGSQPAEGEPPERGAEYGPVGGAARAEGGAHDLRRGRGGLRQGGSRVARAGAPDAPEQRRQALRVRRARPAAGGGRRHRGRGRGGGDPEGGPAARLRAVLPGEGAGRLGGLRAGVGDLQGARRADGGRISVDSEEGAGTTVKIQLPEHREGEE
jgi:PAS domain-containing protein